MSLVTVLIPTYNRAPYLREAMASVLAQSMADLALVVCDNASTDDTREVVGGFGDERVRLVARPENVGMVENHRRALAEEAGASPYVLMISDDDLLEPTMIEETIGILAANPSVGLVHGAFRLIDGDGDVLLPFANWTGDRTEDGIESRAEFLRKGMLSPCRVCASTAMMRAEATVRVEPEDYPPIDLGMWLRLAVGWDVGYLHRVLASYRIHAGTHSATFGGVAGAGYTFSPDLVFDVHRVKMRFLTEHADQLAAIASVDEMRALAARDRRQSLVLRARQLTLPERGFVRTARQLAGAVRRDPRVVIEPAAWSLLAGSIVGSRGVARLRRARLRAR